LAQTQKKNQYFTDYHYRLAIPLKSFSFFPI